MNISTYYGLSSSGYYSLAQSGGTAVTTASTNAAKTAAVSGAANENLSAYLLDLSPQARDYLNHSAVNAIASGFTLSQAQQSSIDTILQKYKDQPYTQDTFNQIQSDLQKAGLSPDQLASQQQVKDFNPTQTLINAMTGNKSNNNDNALVLPQNNGSQYESQKQNFVQGLVDKFKKIAAPVVN